MQLSIGQQMKMAQQMKLAPRMIQSMEILQLTIMDLRERIEQELIENPLLEEPAVTIEPVGADTDTSAVVGESTEVVNEKPLEQRELVVDSENNEADFERLSEMAQSDWPDDDYTYSPRLSSNQMSDDEDRRHDTISNMQSRPQSLLEYLLEQFRFFTCSPEVRNFAEFLIQNLDANGRLPQGLPESIEIYGQPVSEDDAQFALSLIQKLEPRGVGARDLKECLLLQVRDDHPLRQVLVTLISTHLDDLCNNRLPVIERRTGFSMEAIKDAWEELRQLDPFPGRGFEATPVANIVPDLFIEQDSSGRYVVRLEDEYTPRLNISKKYQQLLSTGDQQTKEYIKRKIESAKWLIESIEQRYNTMRKVAQAIVDHQKEFLDRGPEFIVPLKMQQIADVVGVHVTTVSRAVDDKHVQTPRGIFALKRFFGGGTKTVDGEDDVAWDVIRIRLKEIVDGEDKSDPLSDDALVEELAKAGYKLARRTVTKYRKALAIPSSRQRKAY